MSEGSEVVEVHELTQRPTDYWRSWKKTANVMRLQVRQPSSPPSEDKVSHSSQSQAPQDYFLWKYFIL